MNELVKSFYEKEFLKLPAGVKRALSYLESKLELSPRIYHDPVLHPAEGLPKGVVTISIDFELSWACQYSKEHHEDFVDKGLRERAQVPLMLSKFDQYNIPATWATVGHLFLSECERGADGLAHTNMPRLDHFESRWWRFSSGDWYQFDPCTNLRQDPAWYAPDLIEMILSSRADHEIACHSFSHAGFGVYCPEEVAAAELDACANAMAPFGLKPTTMVFPGNEEGHYAVLARKGVRVVRSRHAPAVDVSLPYLREDGIWTVHVSSNLDSKERWTFGQRLARLKRFVDVAADTKLSAHVWLHPSLHPQEMHHVLFPFLEYCAGLRDQGSIEILTMEKLVAATERARACQTPVIAGR